MSDHETTLRKEAHGLGVRVEMYPMEEDARAGLLRLRAACLAGADALRRTCGTCDNWMTSHGSAWDRRHPCHFYGGVPRTADDGCIKGYAPKEVSRG